jgi:hypothetical protein
MVVMKEIQSPDDVELGVEREKRLENVLLVPLVHPFEDPLGKVRAELARKPHALQER